MVHEDFGIRKWSHDPRVFTHSFWTLFCIECPNYGAIRPLWKMHRKPAEMNRVRGANTHFFPTLRPIFSREAPKNTCPDFTTHCAWYLHRNTHFFPTLRPIFSREAPKNTRHAKKFVSHDPRFFTNSFRTLFCIEYPNYGAIRPLWKMRRKPAEMNRVRGAILTRITETICHF
jgi:hypothetical protein